MKNVYLFSEGNKNMGELLGNKGAKLSEMNNLKIPIPPGFTITTETCIDYLKNNKFSKSLKNEIISALKKIETDTGKKFGDTKNPLLVSVRSGAFISMPGMMETILNIGLNDQIVKEISKTKKHSRWIHDNYRRLIQMYSEVVLKIPKEHFENTLSKIKIEEGVKKDHELSTHALTKVIKQYKEILKKHNKSIPSNPEKQLYESITSVFESWNTKRAIKYRELNKIPKNLGTGAVVQTMVYGNKDKNSGTGVVFTRNPSTGKKELYGEYLINAQGEDVVSGARTPHQITELKKHMPKIYTDLAKLCKRIEEHFKDMQDIEFTIENNRLYILQTRTGKRTAAAAVKIAVEMVSEEKISKKDAILRISTSDIERLLHPIIDPNAEYDILAKGLNASPGAASGKVFFDTNKAAISGKSGEKIILVREETTPDDIHGIAYSQGVLTTRGGMTSHAAVVARGMGKPCVCGCETIKINHNKNHFNIGSTIIREGDTITINGTTGVVIKGDIPLIPPRFNKTTKKLLNWANSFKKLKVRANASTPEGAKKARELGAEGIGLCRTERMFNAPDRLPIMRQMILAESKKDRINSLEKLLPLQKKDFKEIFSIMEGLPVTVRLLDIPLHEFLPPHDEIIQELNYLKDFKDVIKHLQEFPHILKLLDSKLDIYAEPVNTFIKEMNNKKYYKLDEKLIEEKTSLLKKVRALEEVNPMLGHRGVRLGITYPEIYEMQIRAIYEASAELMLSGVNIYPEIMVPQVCTSQELIWVYRRVKKIAKETESQYGITVPIKFGTMIEVVRACMRAGKLAEVAEFFSFGTNDLSQATFSFSREDAESKFLPLYTSRRILQDNPFEILDKKGVGRLMMITIEWGRKKRKNLKIGICGEQGGEPSSIRFCQSIGIDYVSCSPYRVAIARLASAHAALENTKDK